MMFGEFFKWLCFWDKEIEEAAEEAHTGERSIVAREMVWQIELNDYQRSALLLPLRSEVNDTGDSHCEIRAMLEKDPEHERLYWR